MRKISLQKVVKEAISEGAKSVFLFPGFPPMANKREIIQLTGPPLRAEEVENLLRETVTEWQYNRFKEEKELDYGYEIGTAGRSRICAFVRSGSTGIVIRPIPSDVPSFASLSLPETLKRFTELSDGLVLVTGPTGSGKSTTLAALLDIVNEQRVCHIVTIEDPIEFVYTPKRSIISQREIGRDTQSFEEALKRMLREDPDVVLVGEIRDKESMQAVLEIAETGHLVFSTLHTSSVTESINRIIDLFPDHEKGQVMTQLAQVLRGVVSQRLMQRIDGKGFACACEVLVVTQPVRNLIKSSKTHQIPSAMAVAKKDGMILMDDSLLALMKQGIVDVPQIIKESSQDKTFMERIADLNLEQNRFMGRTLIDFDREKIAYETDYRYGALRNLDASGILLDTPARLLFRQAGPRKDGFHFLIDYSILNGKKDSFPLNVLFSLSYRVAATNVQKPGYRLFLRVVADAKEEIDIPREHIEIMGDGEWHTVTLPVPKAHKGKTVKYLMIFFDSDIREIFFDNIRFI